MILFVQFCSSLPLYFQLVGIRQLTCPAMCDAERGKVSGESSESSSHSVAGICVTFRLLCLCGDVPGTRCARPSVLPEQRAVRSGPLWETRVHFERTSSPEGIPHRRNRSPAHGPDGLRSTSGRLYARPDCCAGRSFRWHRPFSQKSAVPHLTPSRGVSRSAEARAEGVNRCAELVQSQVRAQ